MQDRAWVYQNYYYMDRRRAIWRAAKLINRVWRVYVGDIAEGTYGKNAVQNF